MTEEEAKRAAATFEFPGFRAEAMYFTLTEWHIGHRELGWYLAVYDVPGGEYRLFTSPQQWLDYWRDPVSWLTRKPEV